MIAIESMLMDLAVQALNENDGHRGLTFRESLLLRIMKVAEEGGEVAEAVIGWTGQNPRKTTAHTEADVIAELADVTLTAMVAMASMTDDWQVIIARTYREKLTRLVDAVGPDIDPEANSTLGMRSRRDVQCPYMSAYDMKSEISRILDYGENQRSIIVNTEHAGLGMETVAYATLLQRIFYRLRSLMSNEH